MYIFCVQVLYIAYIFLKMLLSEYSLNCDGELLTKGN